MSFLPRLSRTPLALRTLTRPTLPRAPARLTRLSSTTSTPPPPSRIVTALKRLVTTTFLTTALLITYLSATDTRFTALHRHLIVPSLRYLVPDPERAHSVTLTALSTLYTLGLHPRERAHAAGPDLSTTIFGHVLTSPVGTSAGIDKNASVPDALLALGAAYTEVGGIVPKPQAGNPQPRLFRIPSQNALINRFGLNSLGADAVAARLRERVRRYAISAGFGGGDDGERRVLNGEAGVPPGSLAEGKLMGVQIGKNASTPDDIDSVVADYVYCVKRLARYADVLVVNVSSPNTAGLRDLQAQAPLTAILKAVVKAAGETDRKVVPRVMVKVSPDEREAKQVEGICNAVWDSGVDGVIVGNTTKRRPAPVPAGFMLPADEERILREEAGGYSGPQLFEGTVDLVRKYREELDKGKGGERKTVFGSGGVTNGKEALKVLEAGADMVQVYTALVYGGAGTLTKIKHEMRKEIDRNTPRSD
ncbi:Dihydroorotate dehydrogenase (quinone), mitochondrial [Pseudogymnoascus destructans]|uniref:Dihydroorotate dehydrogenase (Quinone), mitochondrial n=1 Tax=Pseudogymnoascus destructans TaxID=655981 RepID=A0A177A1Z2_9PEZI|nr:Dihydroorotate dehydrogenase (quinone), mitochondrial [Pseudogymnoascus destructans]OAF56117.1 Dihydroorotate dehydrogenase (quinone), mitochondrial [Pseudogymnoascus destructans]